jgi:hypothetical protein
MLTRLKRAASGSRSSAGRGRVSITMHGPIPVRTSCPSGRVAGSKLSRKVIDWFQVGLECSEHYTVLICDWPPQPRHSQTAAIFKIWFVRGRGALAGPTSSTRRSRSAVRQRFIFWTTHWERGRKAEKGRELPGGNYRPRDRDPGAALDAALAAFMGAIEDQG